jgi:hypothetical protein
MATGEPSITMAIRPPVRSVTNPREAPMSGDALTVNDVPRVELCKIQRMRGSTRKGTRSKCPYATRHTKKPFPMKSEAPCIRNAEITNIPEDSAASILTAGLLGGVYVVITPGAAATYLHQGSNMDITESAFSLEHLMKGLTEAAIR